MPNIESQKSRVALVQMACSNRIDENVTRAISQIRTAADQGADIVSLPELFTSRYPCQSEDHRNFDLAETIPGRTSQTLSALAQELDIVIVASLFEQRAAGLYHNTAIVIDGSHGIVGKYRKMHIPDDPLYYEKFYFTPGDLGFPSFKTSRGRIGVCICWDQWFPEAARLVALNGADLILFPTAIGWIPNEKQTYGANQHSAWETMIRSHAIANGLFVGAPNRVGQEDDIEFWGASLVTDPNGNVIAKANHVEEELILADCDFRQVDAVRTHWPFLRDRRIDAYQGLSQRFLDDRTTP
jgi:N-carbamoylputrescine amidase